MVYVLGMYGLAIMLVDVQYIYQKTDNNKVGLQCITIQRLKPLAFKVISKRWRQGKMKGM